jgi:isopentenyldiphosphate isomerase
MRDSDDELLDLVDDDDNVIGRIWRSEAYRLGVRNVRVVNLFLRRSDGALWIPTRTPQKRMFPNALDVSMGGHLRAGETYVDALLRETMEELNIDALALGYRQLGHCTPKADGVHAFQRVYEIRTDEPPPFNPDDFSWYEWLQPGQVLKRIADGTKAKGDLPTLIRRFYIQ